MWGRPRVRRTSPRHCGGTRRSAWPTPHRSSWAAATAARSLGGGPSGLRARKQSGQELKALVADTSWIQRHDAEAALAEQPAA
ncbi:hypothetical protein [Streptomyces atratus]|uniref:hypothetical protein n=1 Tax=Streptomyces atratus TaxID=1893 RepID=UPI0033E68DDA